MKIRTDYVTNSSSSSFILSFKDENSIYETLKDQFPKNIKEGWSCGDNGYLFQLLSEIEEAERLTENDIEEIVFEEKLEEEKSMSYPEVREFLKQAKVKKRLKMFAKMNFTEL